LLKRKPIVKTPIRNKIKQLINYKVSLFIQGIVSIVFLYFFYRINKSTTVLNDELVLQTATSKKLHQIVDSIEQQIAFFNPKDSVIKNVISAHPDTAKKRQPPLQKSSEKTQSTAKPGEQIKTVPVRTIFVTEETKMFEYGFSYEIRLSNSTTITEITGVLLITYSVQKQPKGCKAQIEMKQTDEENNGTVQKLTFRCIKCEAKPDNTFNCIFQENPLPAANELDAQNPRKLSISLTGSLDNSVMNGLLTWNEVSGRPAWARIKMVLKERNQP